MTKKELRAIEKAILDVTETYCDIKIANAKYDFTDIGRVVKSEYLSDNTSVSSTDVEIGGNIYYGLRSVGGTKYNVNDQVYCFVPNGDYQGMFILGQTKGGLVNIQGGTIKGTTIIGSTIQNESGTFQVTANGEITGASLTAGQITSGEFGSDRIADGAIIAGKIAANSITSNEIQTGTITANEIAADTITSAEIKTGTITGSDIAAGTITATNIAAGTITATEISSNYVYGGTISGDKIQGGTISGDLIQGGTLKGVSLYVGNSTYNTDFYISNGDACFNNLYITDPDSSTVKGIDVAKELEHGIEAYDYIGQIIYGIPSILTVQYASALKYKDSEHTEGIAMVSSSSNFVPSTTGVWCGTSTHPWAGMYASGTVSGSNISASSDRKMKNHIKYLSNDDDAINFIMSLKPVEFNWKDKNIDSRNHYGFYAQDVEQEAITALKDNNNGIYDKYKLSKEEEEKEIHYPNEKDSKDMKWDLHYNEFIAPMVATIQKQQRQIQSLTSRIKELEDKIQ